MTTMITDLPTTITRLLSPDALQCIQFILELDKLKSVKRRSPLLDNSRVETDAEHSWHVAMMALLLSAGAQPAVNADTVVKMLLVHDIVEIDAGDTFLYDTAAEQDQSDRETRGANRLFAILPAPLRDELNYLWREFEDGKTPEARFAKGVDRLQPLLQNYFSGGGTWNMPQVHKEQVLERKRAIEELGSKFWNFAQALIDDGAQRGILRKQLPAQVGAKNEWDAAILSNVTTIEIADAPTYQQAAAEKYERRFDCKFSTLTRFPDKFLKDLHANLGRDEANIQNHSFRANVASMFDESIIEEIGKMTLIANRYNVTRAQNVEYFETVLNIYGRLRGGMEYLTTLDDTLCIGPEREGAIIAQTLSCLPAGRSSRPIAKRIPDESGLIVGLALENIRARYDRCVIIDGAIASGSTLIAIMQRLTSSISEFHVFSAHATASSLRALSRYAQAMQIILFVNVGHVSGTLNEKRYALHTDGTLVIGDIGDLICPGLE